MKDIKVVAFDCDGVMFESKGANTAYYNEILEYFHLPAMTPEQLDYAHMHTSDSVLAHFFKDEQMLSAAQDYQQKMEYRKFIRFMTMEPDLKPLLKWLKPNYKTAIATNRTYTMDWVLAEFGLDADFDFVVSAKDVLRPKPDPEPLIKILSHFNVQPDEALYVGDSTLDELAAKAAGIPLVAYGNPSLSAAYHIRSLKELRAILDG
jgi:HAD superfamily hydrolase (TIGR01549 family)